MDSNNVRSFRGKARGKPRQSGPANQVKQNPPKYQVTRPEQPRQHLNAPGPQSEIPPRQKQPTSSHDNNKFSDIAQKVEQLSSDLENVNTGLPIPLGRGVARGNRSVPIAHYRAVRPQSSYGQTGKQGLWLSISHGQLGQPVEMVTNYFPITSYTKWELYQYRVDFNPEEVRIHVQRGLLAAHRKILGPFIFDGTMMFSSKKYETDIIELTSKRDSDDKIFIIKIKFTNVVETGDYANIQVFNLLLRKCLRHLELKLIGRNYYDPKAKIDIQKHKLQVWPGYETTIGMFESGLLMRAEISCKIMRQETAFDIFRECYKNQNNEDPMNSFKTIIIGSVVMTMYNNETYRIDDVDETVSINSTFNKIDGSSMSYVDYYKEKWNITIRGGQQPMLVSKKKKPFGQRNEQEDLIYLVPEFCYLTGLNQSMRKNHFLMQDLAKFTRVNPGERINRLKNFIQRLNSTPKSVEAFESWNLKLNNDLVKLTGRILKPELVHGSRDFKCDGAAEADWTKYLREFPMFTSALIKRWAVLTPHEFVNDCKTYIMSIKRVSDKMSFNLPLPEIVPLENRSTVSYIKHLEQVINSVNPSMILCVLATNRSDTYNAIKRKLCCDRAVPSQVVLLRSVQNNNLSVCTKIAIQLNSKLGGAPWMIKIPRSGLMIVGFDVCHNIANRSKSYGALVATLNNHCSSYFSCVEEHEVGEELSNYMATGIAKALSKYKYKNGVLPSGIIVYRDGVGDGQLSHVHKIEVNMIKSVCKEFYQETPVPLAFIIVKKRISTRFFINPKQGGHNPPPGTVVDSVVTDPTMYDFFLVSQNVKQGTVTPTHYNVIEDTLVNWSPTYMQALTYKLTHLYYNWSGTVRVPAPCQLAHKLAFLTAKSLNTIPNSGLDELLYYL